MATSIEARVVRRPLRLDSFGHITAVPLVAFDSLGLLFDGDLTDIEIGDVWWFATSTDDADQARREAIAVSIADAEAGTNGAGWLTDAYAALARYAIGLQE